MTYAPFPGAFAGNPPSTPTPTPPLRLSLKLDRESHAASLATEVDGDRVYYYPTVSSSAEPSSVVGYAITPYSLQWINQPELQGTSLWFRRNASLATTIYTPFTVAAAIGPHDVQYWSKFAGDNYGNHRASAPWGFRQNQEPSWVHLGDWHNHPAWAWASHYHPMPGHEGWYDYCRALECRLNNSYIDNIYWSDDPIPGWTGDDTPYCADVSCLEPNAPAPDASEQPELHALFWGFDSNLGGVNVSGPQLERADLASAPDRDWGYGDGRVSLLRVVGSGRIRVILPTTARSDQLKEAVIRSRRSGGAELASDGFTVRWQREGESQVPDERGSEFPRLYKRGEWEVHYIDLRRHTEWRAAGQLRFVVLEMWLGQEPGNVLEIDFVTLSP